MGQRIKLPEPVVDIYRAVVRLEELYPGWKFTPDGHLVGPIGEVIAAEALPLPSSLRSMPAMTPTAVRAATCK